MLKIGFRLPEPWNIIEKDSRPAVELLACGRLWTNPLISNQAVCCRYHRTAWEEDGEDDEGHEKAPEGALSAAVRRCVEAAEALQRREASAGARAA